ncbi:hypothetical protein [Sphingomonas sp.]|jgi:hypothetical protein|uniref:hypothetical protein n=1 Tax=Sphingomonas sp. TaxID=28214 RepID=UPI002ED9738F
MDDGVDDAGLGELAGDQAGEHGPRVQWSPERKAAFLDHLAATCNVSASAAVVGVPATAIYPLRRRDADFAAAWGEALISGYEMLETQLVGHALNGGGARETTNGDVTPTGTIDVDLALKLLGTHQGAMLGKPLKGGPKLTKATSQETTEAILKKLRAIEGRVRRGRGPALAKPLLIEAQPDGAIGANDAGRVGEGGGESRDAA